ncbi:hypothetical protein PBI_LARENN_1 [Mycobacterium phage Larenn]|uniref:Uncharacterized protein n=1 Tax=Mycobacterium phage Larenn TaxID=1560285 RepID=A0A0A0RRD2_9CAUD|nr:hypothetical protein PBI_LARENN_1 [Mycobacterium phage Larenn]AIW02897.1 hypothetical protein PBI_LARENN_1 [Mycobacterium phage Larenn]
MKILRSLVTAVAIVRLAARGGWDIEIYDPFPEDEEFLG